MFQNIINFNMVICLKHLLLGMGSLEHVRMCVINPTRNLDVYVLFGVAEHVRNDSSICA